MSFNNRMTPSELKATLALASIMSIRLLGLFMIFPVFTLYAQQLPDVTPILIGLALGIYGLTQGILQIPFGMLSDRIGRKPIIYLGLLIFALGSVVAATSTSIVGIIIGRALQGCGAIASTMLALTADLTREEQRTKGMAIMGISIGTSFILALTIGPLLNGWIGVPGIFWLTAIFALVAIVILHFAVPQPTNYHSHHGKFLVQLKGILQDTQLLRLNIGILFLHLLLTSLFVVLPIALLDNQLPANEHWQIYVSVLIASVIAMVPVIWMAEKYRQIKPVFVGAVVILGLSQLGLTYFYHNLTGIILMLFLFFTAVNILESNLPSLISKMAPANCKGTAMGVYSSSQFFGAFLGGLLGGWLHQHYGIGAVFSFCGTLTVIWFIFAVTMQKPLHLSNYSLKVGELNKYEANELTQCLTRIPGVAEAMVITEDQVAYLKVDRKILDVAALNKCSIDDGVL